MDLGGRMKQDARIETFIGLPNQGAIQACWLHNVHQLVSGSSQVQATLLIVLMLTY